MNVKSPEFNLHWFRNLVREQDDRAHNSLCVSADGEIYFQSWRVNEKRPPFPADGFRFETFAARNGYVGSRVAGDHKFIELLYEAVRENWNMGTVGYIDYWA